MDYPCATLDLLRAVLGEDPKSREAIAISKLTPMRSLPDTSCVPIGQSNSPMNRWEHRLPICWTSSAVDKVTFCCCRPHEERIRTVLALTWGMSACWGRPMIYAISAQAMFNEIW